jgi:hypothetical protein
MYDLVAATLDSVPAPSGIERLAMRASGDPSTLTSASTNAPAAFAAAAAASRSGLAPDCEIAMKRTERRSARVA